MNPYWVIIKERKHIALLIIDSFLIDGNRHIRIHGNIKYFFNTIAN